MNAKLLGSTIAILMLAPQCGICAEEGNKPTLRLKDAPDAWKQAELNEAMPYRGEEGLLHVLAWQIIHDQVVMEHCLVIKQYKKPSKRGETCALGYLARHPKAERPTWEAVTLWITPDPEFKNPPAIWGYELFKKLPSDEEIDIFLKDRSWDFRRDEPSTARLLDGGVCRGAWKAVLQREPDAKIFPELLVGNDALTTTPIMAALDDMKAAMVAPGDGTMPAMAQPSGKIPIMVPLPLPPLPPPMIEERSGAKAVLPTMVSPGEMPRPMMAPPNQRLPPMQPAPGTR